MNIKQIKNLIYDDLCQNENLSLPYIANIKGKEQLCFFVFECSDSDMVLEITDVPKIICVDYDTTDYTIVEQLPALEYPINIHFDFSYPIEELNQLYEKYDKTIERYLRQMATRDECVAIASKVMSEDYKTLCRKLGATNL